MLLLWCVFIANWNSVAQAHSACVCAIYNNFVFSALPIRSSRIIIISRVYLVWAQVRTMIHIMHLEWCIFKRRMDSNAKNVCLKANMVRASQFAPNTHRAPRDDNNTREKERERREKRTEQKKYRVPPTAAAARGGRKMKLKFIYVVRTHERGYVPIWLVREYPNTETRKRHGDKKAQRLKHLVENGVREWERARRISASE